MSPRARRGGRWVCSVRIAIFLVAACAGAARASVVKVIQRPCGMRLQKLQRLVHSPPSPPTPLHPRRGDQVSSTALCGQRFVWGGVHVQRPTFKLAGNKRSDKRVGAAFVHFEGWQRTMNAAPLKTRPHRVVEGRFEGWRLTVNSSTSNTRPHRAVGPPFPPGGAGVGVRVGVAAQELLHFR